MDIIVFYYILGIFLVCFFTAAYLYWVLLRNQRTILQNQERIVAKLDHIAWKLIEIKRR